MSHHSQTKTELSVIGAEAFALLDDNFPAAAPPPRRTPPQLFPFQYKRQQAYVVHQVPVQRTETVINCYEAINKYGGAHLVEYPKRKTACKGFFF